jgi:hypothetical protein
MLLAKKKNLVFSSVGDNSKHGLFWLSEKDKRQFDLFLIYFGDNPNRYSTDADYYVQRKGSKWTNFYWACNNYADVISCYDAVFVVDDDIEISTSSINDMFSLFHRYQLWLAQPVFTRDSHIHWGITKEDRFARLRYVNFVEVGVVIFSKYALQKCKETFQESTSGAGLDFLWPFLLGYPRDKIALIDSIPCRHRQRKSDIDQLLPRDEQNNEWEKIKDKYKYSKTQIVYHIVPRGNHWLVKAIYVMLIWIRAIYRKIKEFVVYNSTPVL